MSTRRNNGSHYENHPSAVELHNYAAHAHQVAEQHKQQTHLSGTEQSRQAHEHSTAVHRAGEVSTNRHGLATFNHHDIEVLAYELWEARGCPIGSPEEDWCRALEELRASVHAR